MNYLAFVLADVSVKKDGAPDFIQTVKDIFEQVAGWAYVLAPSIALVLLIIAGIKFMNANDPQSRGEVKHRFKNIFFGILIVFFAVQILNFLIQKFA